MSETFKVGDVVSLKSGGPPMTVTGISPIDGDVGCAWCKGFGSIEHDSFSAASLAVTDKRYVEPMPYLAAAVKE